MSKKNKKKKYIEIPLELARLLTARVEDLKEPAKYDEIQTVAKALLRLLIVASEDE